MNKKILSLLCAFASVSSISDVYAAEFKLNNIKVIGLQRVDEGVIYNSLPVAIGETFRTEDTSEYIKAIYKTGYFKSITINRDKNDIIVYVKERPSISSIKINGNDSMETEVLNKALSSVDIKEGGTFDEFTIQKITQELEQQYLSQGKYAVRIKTEIKALERNRVGLVINISEGKVAKIKQIKIIGNKDFSEAKLLEEFSLSEGSVISWFTLSDRYSKQKLSGDLERLKSFYQDRGYLNFKINDTQISLTPDKKNVYITVQITEGDVYSVGNINIGGKYHHINPELKKIVDIKRGEIYSAKRISDAETEILNNLGRSGYSFAKVEINKNIDFEKKIVDVTFFIQPGSRVYVRRINFAGNVKTQDQVLRRELLQMEGGFISREKIEESKQRLYQLGYIKDINVETIPVPGNNDQVDLKYNLEETNTGHLNGGLGYSDAEGVMFNLGLSQDNFFGTGKSVALDFNKSPAVVNYNMRYFDPYFTIDGIGLGYDLFYNKTKLSKLDVTDYRLDMYGFDLSLSLPMSMYDVVRTSIGAQNKTLVVSPTKAAAEITAFRAKHHNSNNIFPYALSWRHNRLDRALMPTKGWGNDLGGSITVPFSDINFFQVYNLTKYYIPVYNEFILHLKGSIGYKNGYNNDNLPFFEHYYSGGTGSVRGFVQNSLGPLDSRGQAFGGGTQLQGTVEMYMPKLFAPNASWRPSVFVDAGNVFKNKIKPEEIRAAAGVGVQWLSPMGPLSVSYAVPIRHKKDDQLRGFNFAFGSSF